MDRTDKSNAKTMSILNSSCGRNILTLKTSQTRTHLQSGGRRIVEEESRKKKKWKEEEYGEGERGRKKTSTLKKKEERIRREL